MNDERRTEQPDRPGSQQPDRPGSSDSGQRADVRSRVRETARTTLRAVSGLELTVLRRRAQQDVGLLVAVVALVAVAMLLAVTGPRLVLATVDGGVRDVIQNSGADSDVLVVTSVGDSGGQSAIRTIHPDSALAIQQAMPGSLPPALREVYADSTLSVFARDAIMRSRPGDDAEYRVRLGMITPVAVEASELVEGRMPEAGRGVDDPIEVVISRASAEQADLAIGDVVDITVSLGSRFGEAAPSTGLVVVGIVEPAGTGDAGDDRADAAPRWEDLPEFWSPFERDATPTQRAFTRIAVLTDPSSVTVASSRLRVPFEARVRIDVDLDRFTTVLATEVADEIDALSANGSQIAADTGAVIDVRSDLGDILESFPAQARAALAQMSVMIAGVIGVAAVVVVLLTRLLVLRRAASLALERARGASVAAVTARAAVESFFVALAGGLVGVLLSFIVSGGWVRDALPVVAVFLIALLAAPVQVALLARGVWTGRREPANRQDRVQLANRKRAIRIVAEVSIIALAVGALLSLRARGLLQTRTDGVDPFLAAAPLLLAVAVTVVVLRLYPPVVRFVSSFGRRTRGVLGLLGAVRAQRAVAVLPLLALTLGVALAVGGGLLVETVRSGQSSAAWERVGADLRIDAPLSSDDVQALRAREGITGAGAMYVKRGVSLDLGTTSEAVTVLGIDAGYPDVIDDLPATTADGQSAQTGVSRAGLEHADLRELASAAAAEGRMPIIVHADIASRLLSTEAAMYIGPRYLQVEVIGITEHAPTGLLEGPFVFADLDALDVELPEPIEPTAVFVTGEGAAAAAATVSAPDAAVTTREEWIDARRSLALVRGVETMMVFAVGAVVLLAIVALISTVFAGAKERGRSLSMLRTLGMSSRLGWWLALAELAPIVVAAVLGGVVAGAAVVLLLAPSLGLDVLAGGLSIPEPSLSPSVIAGLAVASVVLLIVAVLAEVVAHRRDRLSEVLRVGETV